MDLRETKIDLRSKTEDEKREIFDKIKPFATGYCRGSISIKCIEKKIDLLGNRIFRMHKCYSVSSDLRFEVHLQDFSFVLLPYKAIEV